jgi:hypothetical protein
MPYAPTKMEATRIQYNTPEPTEFPSFTQMIQQFCPTLPKRFDSISQLEWVILEKTGKLTCSKLKSDLYGV